MHLIQVEQQVHRCDDLVAVLAGIARKIAELREHHQDRNPAEKADHHRVGHKTHQAAQLEQTGDDLEQPHQQGERKEGRGVFFARVA